MPFRKNETPKEFTQSAVEFILSAVSFCMT